MLLLLLLATSDPRMIEAQQLSAHGEDETALQVLVSVLHDVEASGERGSHALHHNIGTLALKTGDAGLAMQHLLSAQRREPGNDDTLHNLKLARQLRADRLESSSTDSIGAHIPPHAARFAFAVCAFFFGLCVFARAAFKRVPLALVVVAGIAFAASCAALFFRVRCERSEIVVVMKDTKAREAPDAKATGFDVHPGLVGEKKQERGNLTQLRLENGVDVWIASTDLATVR